LSSPLASVKNRSTNNNEKRAENRILDIAIVLLFIGYYLSALVLVRVRWSNKKYGAQAL